MSIKFEQIEPPPSREDIAELERVVGFRLNPDYIDFIIKYNGGCPPDNYFDVPGNRDCLNWVVSFDELTKEIPYFSEDCGHGIVPLFRCACGNFLLMLNQNGEIYYWNHEMPPEDSYFWMAPSLSSFMRQVHFDDTRADGSEPHLKLVRSQPDGDQEPGSEEDKD